MDSGDVFRDGCRVNFVAACGAPAGPAVFLVIFDVAT